MAEKNKVHWVGVQQVHEDWCYRPGSVVTVGLVSTQILEARPSRKGFFLKNTSAETCYISFSSAATIGAYPLVQNEVLDCTFYHGKVFGICAANSADIAIIDVG